MREDHSAREVLRGGSWRTETARFRARGWWGSVRRIATNEPFPGAGQLQHAALAMIAASRAVLDALEAVVRDPAAARTVVDAARRPAGPAAPAGDDSFERIEVT